MHKNSKTKPRVNWKKCIKGNWMRDWIDSLNGGSYKKNDKN